MSGEKRGRESSYLLSRLRKDFKETGRWIEPFGEYLFLGELSIKTVHTTFFMKDYELNSYFYILGVKEIKDPKSEFEKFKKFTKKLLKTPPDHYLSTFILLTFGGNFEPLTKTKSLLFGFKGKAEWALYRFNGKEIEGKELSARPLSFLNSLLTF